MQNVQKIERNLPRKADINAEKSYHTTPLPLLLPYLSINSSKDLTRLISSMKAFKFKLSARIC